MIDVTPTEGARRLRVLEKFLREEVDDETRQVDTHTWGRGAAASGLGWATTIREFQYLGLNWNSPSLSSWSRFRMNHVRFEGLRGFHAAQEFFGLPDIHTAFRLFGPAPTFMPFSRRRPAALQRTSLILSLEKQAAEMERAIGLGVEP